MIKTKRNTFGDKLILALRNKNISQKELADRIGVTQATISRYITGLSTPTSGTLQKLSRELNLPINYFFTVDGLAIQEKQDNDIRVIQRAREKMSDTDKQRMMDILRIAFCKEFNDEE
jgi:DNA-binding helix-turn-helix protein